jgi:hypothetical protein
MARGCRGSSSSTTRCQDAVARLSTLRKRTYLHDDHSLSSSTPRKIGVQAALPNHCCNVKICCSSGSSRPDL